MGLVYGMIVYRNEASGNDGKVRKKRDGNIDGVYSSQFTVDSFGGREEGR